MPLPYSFIFKTQLITFKSSAIKTVILYKTPKLLYKYCLSMYIEQHCKVLDAKS